MERDNPSTMGDIAIITARSGSKRLPGKNIMELMGHPLMAWTIRAALASQLFDRVLVSTDSPEYAQIAIAYGAEVPGLRGENLSGDHVSSADVVYDILENLRHEGYHCNTLMLLQPTSPLRTPRDMMDARKLYDDKNAEAVVSVCRATHHPARCNTLRDDLSMTDFLPSPERMKREADKVYYRINGAIYLVDTHVFLQTRSLFPSGTYALVMPEERSVDIDDPLDFVLAEALMKRGNCSLPEG